MTSDAHSGFCLCGSVAFEANGPLRDVVACHCSQCRKVSGHYWASTSVDHDQFRLIRDEGLTWYRASPKAARGFCRLCGATLFRQPQGEARIAVSSGAFDGDPPFRLVEHGFVQDAGTYYSAEGPPPVPVVAGRLNAACLCGGVSFALPGPSGDIVACHCIQCRKLSGHFSASFDADEASVTYQGRDTLAEYETPGGGRRGFCTRCGSSLYFRSAQGEFSVEAGSVCGPTGGSLTEHIFTAFKASYYDLNDGLPQCRGAQ